MRGFLADYSVDLEVYDYWLWRYYPEWIDWYRNQQTQAGSETPADTPPQEQPGMVLNAFFLSVLPHYCWFGVSCLITVLLDAHCPV